MTSRATLNVTRRDEPHFHLGRRSSTFCGVWGGSRAWTRFFPAALERGAAPILRECSINCWGDPWQQRSSNQPPSLSTSLTLSRTNTYLQTPHSRSPLLECSEEGITRKRLPLVENLVIKVTDREPAKWPTRAAHQGQVTAERTRCSGPLERLHFRTDRMLVANLSGAWKNNLHPFLILLVLSSEPQQKWKQFLTLYGLKGLYCLINFDKKK